MTNENELAKVEPMPLGAIDTPDQATAIDYPAMLKLAIISKDVDVDKLERVAALVHRSEDRKAEAIYTEAFAKFQDECPEVYHNRKVGYSTSDGGGSVKYTYVDLPEALRLVRPVLRANDFTLSWDGEQTKDWCESIFTLRHISGHSKSSKFGCSAVSGAGMSSAQKQGAAMTYCKRQAMIMRLGIVAMEDDTDARITQPPPTTATAKITEKEANDINDMILELENTPEEVNMVMFYDHFNVQKVSELTPEQYPQAMDVLKGKLGRLKTC